MYRMFRSDREAFWFLAIYTFIIVLAFTSAFLWGCSRGSTAPASEVNQILNSLTLTSTDGHRYALIWYDKETGGNLALFDKDGKDKWFEWWNALLGRPNPPVSRFNQLPKGIR